MQRSRVFLYLAVLVASLAYLSAWHAADHAPGVTPSAERLMAPLDDAYIFGQYARQALKGEWLHYTPGAPISTGVSSFSWLLGLTALMGLGWPLTWAAWALGALCLGWSVHSLLRLSFKLFPGLPDWFLPALFLVHASSVSLYFQGMDSGLLLAALLACADAALDPAANKRFWALATLLAFTRPEGQLMVPALALARAWPLGMPGRLRAALVGLALAAAPTLCLWAYSGAPVPDSVRPKTAGMNVLGAADRLATTTRYTLDVSRSILMGWPGRQAQVGVAGHASAGNDPSKHFPLFSLLVAALGLLFAWRQGSQRAWWAAMATAWALTFLLLAWTLPVGWHRHRYLAPLWPLMLLAFVAAIARLQAAVRPWQRLTRSALLTLWLGFGLLTWPWFLRSTFQSALNYARANREAAFALSAMSVQNRVVVEDAGLLAYYSGRPIIDLLGVTDHRFAMAQAHGPQAVFQELLTRNSMGVPMVAALHPQRTGSYSQLWASPGPLTPTAALGDMVLYNFLWSPKAK